MFVHSILLVIHVLSAVTWLGFFPVEILMRRKILEKLNKGKCDDDIISDYLSLSSFTGKVGLIGILITGLILSIHLPYYSIFDFSSNHWLAAKQIVMVVIILLVGFVFMRHSRELRRSLTQTSSSSNRSSEEEIKLINKLGGISMIIHLLVLLNFLFAITHRFFSYG